MGNTSLKISLPGGHYRVSSGSAPSCLRASCHSGILTTILACSASASCRPASSGEEKRCPRPWRQRARRSGSSSPTPCPAWGGHNYRGSERMLFTDSISMRLGLGFTSGTCTAIWSPSKSAFAPCTPAGGSGWPCPPPAPARRPGCQGGAMSGRGSAPDAR